MAIDWRSVRKDYEEDGMGMAALALKYRCEQETIRRRSQKQGWRRKTRRAKRPEDTAHVEGQTPPAPAPGAGPGDIAKGHRNLWKGVKKRLVKGLKASDLKAGLEELKVAKVAGEVLTSVIKGERQAWGIEITDQDTLDDTEDITRKMASVTVSSGADEALD